MKMNLMADAVVFDSNAERYVPGGYHEFIPLEKRFETMSKTPGLNGMGITWPTDPLPSDPDKLVKLFADYNLKPGDCSINDYDNKKWKHGPLVTTEKNIRTEHLKLCKEAIDFASHIPGMKVMIWPGHDGFDYPFQTNYSVAWGNMIENLKEICSYNPKIKVCIEYKAKDPRQRFYIGNIGKLTTLFSEVGMDNLMGVIDTGHALQCQESLGEDFVFLNDRKKLGIIHLNDNYRDADPDLIVGTLAFWDNLEFFYYLVKSDYEGTIEIDYQTPREEQSKSLNLAVRMVYKYKELAEKLVKHEAEIEKNLLGYHFADNMQLITDLIF